MENLGSVLPDMGRSAGSGEPPASSGTGITQAEYTHSPQTPNPFTPETPDTQPSTLVTETEPATPASAPGVINWDTPDNPYVERFKGLQATVQREVEQRQQLEREMQQLKEQAVRAQIANLRPEQQEQVMRRWREQEQLNQKQRQLREYEESLEQAARVVITEGIARQYNVDVREIQDLNDPELMIKWAQRLSRLQNQQHRQAQQVDRFEGLRPAPTRAPMEKPKTYDEAEAMLMELGQRLRLR